MKANAWRVPGCDLSLLKTIGLLHLGFNNCSSVTDNCILKAVNGRSRKRRVVAFSRCNEVTDAGVSALGAGCGQLQSITLARCDKLTDAGISALSVVSCRIFGAVTRLQMQVYQR